MVIRILLPMLVCSALLLSAPLPAQATPDSVYINEIAWMGTAISANDEWFELYNTTNAPIDLTGWTLQAIDGSPSMILTGSIPAHGLYLLERTDDDTVPSVAADGFFSGSISNSGEHLKLITSDGVLVDELNALSGWPGGDNTTKQTLQRINSTTWQTSVLAGGTPKTPNSPAVPEQPDNQDDPKDDTPVPTSTPETVPTLNQSPHTNTVAAVEVDTFKRGAILLTEIYPNPPGIDYDDEFIELYNPSKSVVDLTGWTARNRAGQSVALPHLRLYPSSIVALYRSQTGLAINNDADTISIHSPRGATIDSVVIQKHFTEGISWQRAENTWHEAEPTPGLPLPALPKQNQTGITLVVSAPAKVAVDEKIYFDASDSFSVNQKNLKFTWLFPDGVQKTGVRVSYAFPKAGTYDIFVTAHTNTTDATHTIKRVTVSGAPTELTTPSISLATSTVDHSNENTAVAQIPVATIPDIYISEALANPIGADEQLEFIELFNAEPIAIDLSGWSVDDGDGGSKPYVFPDNTIIDARAYFFLDRPQTKITLNNDQEAVRLFNATGKVVDQGIFDEIAEGVSWARDENRAWYQTDSPTPGTANTPSIPTPAPTSTTAKQPASLAKIAETKLESTSPTEPLKSRRTLISVLSATAVLGAGALTTLKKYFG